MRPVFSDEVARELGYQKYWPEKKDWVIATLGCLAAGVVVMGIIVVILMLTGNWERQFQTPTCDKYANYALKDIPARCAAAYKINAADAI